MDILKFGLVSLFNDVYNLLGYLMPISPLKKKQQRYYLTHYLWYSYESERNRATGV